MGRMSGRLMANMGLRGRLGVKGIKEALIWSKSGQEEDK